MCVCVCVCVCLSVHLRHGGSLFISSKSLPSPILLILTGGLEELAVARRLPKAYSTGFVGCVKDVAVDGVELHLVEDALNSPKILHCSASGTAATAKK